MVFLVSFELGVFIYFVVNDYEGLFCMILVKLMIFCDSDGIVFDLCQDFGVDFLFGLFQFNDKVIVVVLCWLDGLGQY